MTIRAIIALFVLVAAVVTIGIALLSAVAKAQQRQQGVPCGPLAILERALIEASQEMLFAVGTVGPDRALRFYVNPQTRTWTALGVLPGGVNACAIASGEAFDMVRPAPVGKPL